MQPSRRAQVRVRVCRVEARRRRAARKRDPRLHSLRRVRVTVGAAAQPDNASESESEHRPSHGRHGHLKASESGCLACSVKVMGPYGPGPRAALRHASHWQGR